MTTGTRRAPKRPWRLSRYGGTVVATYSTRLRALERAKDLLDTGKHGRVLWVHQKMSTDWEEVRR